MDCMYIDVSSIMAFFHPTILARHCSPTLLGFAFPLQPGSTFEGVSLTDDALVSC